MCDQEEQVHANNLKQLGTQREARTLTNPTPTGAWVLGTTYSHTLNVIRFDSNFTWIHSFLSSQNLGSTHIIYAMMNNAWKIKQ